MKKLFVEEAFGYKLEGWKFQEGETLLTPTLAILRVKDRGFALLAGFGFFGCRIELSKIDNEGVEE